MKTKYKILLTTVMTMILLITAFNNSFATNISDFDTKNAPASNIFKAAGNSVVSILTSIGIVLSVIVLAVLGVKYMLGSLDERAEYKRSLMPYFIGAIITFGASTIAQIIYNFVI